MPPRREKDAATSRPKPIRAFLGDGRSIRAEATRPAEGAAGAWHWRVRRCEAPRAPITGEVFAGPPVATVAQVRTLLGRYVAGAARAPEASDQPGDPRLQTLAELVGWYRRAVEKLVESGERSPATAESKRSAEGMLRALPESAVSVWRLRDADVEDLVSALLRKHRTRTAYQVAATVRAAWNWARKRELVPDRDFPRVYVPKLGQDQLEKITPTRGSLRAIHDALPSEWARRAFLVQAATGCRIGEVMNLTVSQIDHARKGLHVRGKYNPRWVPLAHAPEAWAAVLAQAEGAHPDGRLWRPSMAKHFNDLVREVSRDLLDKRVTTNALRRRASRDLLSAPKALDPAVYEALMGHSWQMARDSYVTEDAIDVAEAAERVALGQLPRGQVLQIATRRGSG